MAAPADLPAPQSASELQAVLAAERPGALLLLHRDAGGALIVTPLAGERLTIGRGEFNAVSLPWDVEASRTHAELERVGDWWVIADDGLSTNGTWVDGRRVTSRRRLAGGELIRVGTTPIAVRAAAGTAAARTVLSSGHAGPPVQLSPAQKKVVQALCAPVLDGRLTPATNQEIANELMLSVEAVKTHMKAIFGKLALGPVPQNEKRARVVERALRDGLG